MPDHQLNNKYASAKFSQTMCVMSPTLGDSDSKSLTVEDVMQKLNSSNLARFQKNDDGSTEVDYYLNFEDAYQTQQIKMEVDVAALALLSLDNPGIKPGKIADLVKALGRAMSNHNQGYGVQAILRGYLKILEHIEVPGNTSNVMDIVLWKHLFERITSCGARKRPLKQKDQPLAALVEALERDDLGSFEMWSACQFQATVVGLDDVDILGTTSVLSSLGMLASNSADQTVDEASSLGIEVDEKKGGKKRKRGGDAIIKDRSQNAQSGKRVLRDFSQVSLSPPSG
ncbi:hypothetical protein QFC24_003430 [Naganishia onofrii]|uniref:Uncharacterized protein n=1 Tax=Naganishia onofrii TaxID=1851511 RepID=A0ACC2XJV5_9TREE|nr:hypothetical protein QFC24_003430 [Naganishia onofrii]